MGASSLWWDPQNHLLQCSPVSEFNAARTEATTSIYHGIYFRSSLFPRHPPPLLLSCAIARFPVLFSCEYSLDILPLPSLATFSIA